MGDMMTFPASVEEFMEQYKMTDTERVYSNGTEYVPIYRMKQWFEHCRDQQLPTIDAVPVVRCRECVGRSFWEKDHNGVPVCLLSGLYARNENDFCPYGERKDGDGNG